MKNGVRRSACAVLLVASCSARARADLPALSFDESRQHVYWCGTSVHSPLLFTVVSGSMRVNGLPARSLPPDTTSREREAQRLFGSVPEVQRMHAHGSAYRAAADTLPSLLGRMATRVRAEYVRALPLGAAGARAVALAAVDTNLVDVTQPIAVDSLAMRFTPKGLSRPVAFSGQPGAIQGLEAAARPLTTEAGAAARIEALRKTLTTPGPLVLLMDETTDTSISGGKALEAQRAIQSLVTKTRSGEAVTYGPEDMVVGRDAFDLLLDAARRP